MQSEMVYRADSLPVAESSRSTLDMEKKMSLGLILLIIVILLLVGAFPRWGHSRSWGYGPSGGLGLVLLIIIVLLVLGKI